MTCDGSTRCTRGPQYRLRSYGRRHMVWHVCPGHLTTMARSLLRQYGGPLLVYLIGE